MPQAALEEYRDRNQDIARVGECYGLVRVRGVVVDHHIRWLQKILGCFPPPVCSIISISNDLEFDYN